MADIGICITTYNSPSYFDDLFNSLPIDRGYDIVVVNGGYKYDKEYPVHWIQHDHNYGAAKARNDGLDFLYNRGCKFLFILEDDLIIKSSDIFEKYVEAHKITGLSYFCFASNAWGNGPPFHRTPRFSAEYIAGFFINFYQHSCNECTFRTREIYEKTGKYLESMQYCFDIENYYRISLLSNGHSFWNSPDLSNSDSLIMNNPNTLSRLDSDGLRHTRLQEDYKIFHDTHNINIKEIPDLDRDSVINKLKYIKSNWQTILS